MEYKDYYEIMGLSKDATPDEIKRQYRKLARKYHPDVSKEENAEEKFKEIGEAYEVLSDPEKKQAYDNLSNSYQGGENFNPPPGWEYQHRGPSYTETSNANFSDFFEELFGQQQSGFRQQQQYQHRGEDIQSKLSVSLEDAYHGREVMIQIPVREITNNGSVINKTRSLKVKIPKGVMSGQQIRLQGQGYPGLGGAKAGDLFLEIQCQDHHLFQCKGKDIFLTLPITPWEAALGAEINIPTLHGNVQMKIPANSQGGQKLRLKGRGLPGKIPGDQYLILKIETPKAIDEKSKAIYRQMAEAMPFNPRQALEV